MIWLYAIGMPILFWGTLGLLGWAWIRLGWWLGWFPDPRKQSASARVFGQVRGRMTRLARETLLLIPSKSPTFSKLGGQPDLPADVAWPMGERSPRTFVAQLDLAEVRAAAGPEWLPREGRLYAFYDPGRNGFADSTIVMFSDRAPAPSPPPLGHGSLTERRVSFLPMRSIPSLDWMGVDLSGLGVSEEQLDELANAPSEPFGDELQHRIGGYPAEIQEGQMQVECEFLARGLTRDDREPIPDAVARAAKQWRLLLQIDSDPALGMNWGDGGRLYVFIKEKHARAGDFSKTVSLSQTY